jgi:hypothetical protein
MEGDPEASKIVVESSLAEPSGFNHLPAGVRSSESDLNNNARNSSSHYARALRAYWDINLNGCSRSTHRIHQFCWGNKE